VVSGDLSDRVAVYLQPDFASDASGALNVGQLRDAYFDLFLDRDRTLRLRVGQSKIPFGWENMQSSSNRSPSTARTRSTARSRTSATWARSSTGRRRGRARASGRSWTVG
jgi:hypothetical protein